MFKKMFKEKKFHEVLVTHTKFRVNTTNNTAVTRDIEFLLDGEKWTKFCISLSWFFDLIFIENRSDHNLSSLFLFFYSKQKFYYIIIKGGGSPISSKAIRYVYLLRARVKKYCCVALVRISMCMRESVYLCCDYVCICESVKKRVQSD